MSPQVDKPLKSVTHGQCDARPTVTFPAAWHHRPLTGNKLYCLVTEARVCVNNLPKVVTLAGTQTRDLLSRELSARTVTPPPVSVPRWGNASAAFPFQLAI